MADIKITFSVSMIIAAVLAELMSMLWYANQTPWGRRIGERYFLTAVFADALLVVILKFIIDTHWSIHSWEDAAILSLWVALLYGSLGAPHVVHSANSFSYYFIDVAHKFCFSFVVTFCLWHFKNY